MCAISETYHCSPRPTLFDRSEVPLGLKQLIFFYFVLLCLYLMLIIYMNMLVWREALQGKHFEVPFVLAISFFTQLQRV